MNSKISRLALQGKNHIRIYELGGNCNGNKIEKIELWTESDSVATFIVHISLPNKEEGVEGARVYQNLSDGSFSYIEYSYD